MKKIIGGLVTLATVATMTMTAFAGTISTNNGSDTSDVKGKFRTAQKTQVYSVDVSWGAMEFEYYEGGQQWNKTSHKWEADPADPAGWTVNNNSNTVTLANNSSVGVKASFAFTPNSGYTNLAGKFTYDNADLTAPLDLELPVENKEAKKYTVNFLPQGSIPNTHSQSTYAKMGTITVKLN